MPVAMLYGRDLNTPAGFVSLSQVGIAKEKVVNIGKLSELAAAELFVASAPREVRTVLFSVLVRPFPPKAQSLVP